MADHRHKRDTDARRKPRAATVAAPLALLATASAVTIGVVASNPHPSTLLATNDAASISGAAAGSLHHGDVASRSESRSTGRASLQAAFDRSVTRTATYRAVSDAHTKMWTTTALNLWTGPAESAGKDGEIAAGKQVLITGRRAADRVEIVVDGESRWVTTGYLSEDKPLTAAAGLSMEPCPDPSVESGLTSNAVYVYRSVCHAFPQITSYGGWDAHGEHSSGKALDIMTSDKALGDTIAAFLQQHAAELHLYDVIWWDRIWTPERASEGWRAYGDHGSPTANHMDHVHVSTY
ncbi:mucin-2 protein [Nocardioides mangrovi]|uniref:Mucin-2 protein n=1 Tax=Nocardioides mangrovi TaxID=2874580 RepID=A0ABS7UK45_9ACTN|nr:mucin-2 protein [Nocardioides mangrovi]MBZ5741013.1 mucin-2 protein [Nocardioides mangrovi]